MYKLLGTEEKVKEAMNIVCTANDAKGTKKGLGGKILKPTDFIGPELALESLLCK